MTLAIFDLDNTLIGGDSDYLWGCFVRDRGLVDGENFARQNEQFYADYQAGNLDIHAYLQFALAPLKDKPRELLDDWHADFMRCCIEPIMLPKAADLLLSHRNRGHHLLIITATNHFITRPIADALGVPDLLACEAEIVGGRYTGEPSGIPSYHAGKVDRLEQWLEETGKSIDGAFFYSDSHNDLPLLQRVDHPVAVDPDDTLRQLATKSDWPIISLR